MTVPVFIAKFITISMSMKNIPYNHMFVNHYEVGMNTGPGLQRV